MKVSEFPPVRLWPVVFSLLITPPRAESAPKVLPVLNQPMRNIATLPGLAIERPLGPVFGTEPIDDQVVRLVSIFEINNQPLYLDFALFSNRTPLYRANFLQYVASGAYTNSIIHRSEPGFLLQGGGYTFAPPDSFPEINRLPQVPNEFGVSNTLGTISMAKLGGQPNSATSQWFINMGANSDILDPQSGGFTVFGRVTRGTFPLAQWFGNPSVFQPVDLSAGYGSAFAQLPLDAQNTLILFSDVGLAPLPAGQAGELTTLAYSVVGNSNPSLVAASILPNGILRLEPQGNFTGTAAITVRATDSVNNTVDDTFLITVNPLDNFSTWRSRQSFPAALSLPGQDADRDGVSNLLEFALLGDFTANGAEVLPVAGWTPGEPAARSLTLTFSLRKLTSNLDYIVEANNGLDGTWSRVWGLSDGLEAPAVFALEDMPDRVRITVRDPETVATEPTRFLRLRVQQN